MRNPPIRSRSGRISGGMKKRRKKEHKWMITNTILGSVVIVLCTFLYLYEHRTDSDANRVATSVDMTDQELKEGVNTFTFRTASKLFSKQDNNVIYSPVSLYYTLLLAACGADGETAAQLNQQLGIKESQQAAVFADHLYNIFNYDQELGKISLSASVWKDKNIKFKKNYIKTVKDIGHASIHTEDFEKGTLSAKMEEWVQKQTNGTVVPHMTTDPDDVLYLLNTVYFYGEWREQFNRSATMTDTFYLADGGTVEAEFMLNGFQVHGFSKGDGFTRSFLDLKESGIMYFVLPDEGVSLDSFFESEDRLREVLEGGENISGQVDFQIPKFSIDTSLDGKNMMEQAGLHAVFSRDSDFSKMSDQNLFISELKQDSHLSINEDGVEAAAFTESQIMEAAAIAEEKAEMILDRPFLFGIQLGNYWLFIGVCNNPAQ